MTDYQQWQREAELVARAKDGDVITISEHIRAIGGCVIVSTGGVIEDMTVDRHGTMYEVGEMRGNSLNLYHRLQ